MNFDAYRVYLRSIIKPLVITAIFAVSAADLLSAQQLGKTANVTAYGAKGDGVADDTAAIQNAINDVVAAGGGKIFVPNGTFLVNAKLAIAGNYIYFGGDGPGSRIKAGPGLTGQTYVLEVSGRRHDVEIAHLYFEGKGHTFSDPSSIHGQAESYQVNTHDCWFTNWGYYGGPDYSQSYDGLITRNIITNCFLGITSSGSVYNYGNIISHNTIIACNMGIVSEYGHDITITDNYIEFQTPGYGDTGIRVYGTQGFVVAHNTLFDANAGTSQSAPNNGIRIGSGSNVYGQPADGQITHNSITGFYWAIRLQSVQNTTISDNTVYRPRSHGILLDPADSNGPASVNNLFAHNTLNTPAGTAILESSGGGDGNLVEQNRIVAAKTPATITGSSSKARLNVGYVTENSGGATIAAGTTAVAVTHGLTQIPALKDISVTPTNNLGSATKFWISNVTAQTFTINTDTDPGVNTATFAWSVSTH